MLQDRWKNGQGRGIRSVAAQTVVLLSIIFLFSCIARFGMGPLMPTVEQSLAIDHAGAGMVFFWTSFGYCIGLIASSMISAKISYRYTVLVSSAAVGIFIIATSMSIGLWTLSAGMTLVGVAGGLYLPSGLATITTTVTPGNWGKAFAMHETAANISLALTPMLVELLLSLMSWRGVVRLFGLATLIGCAGFAWSGRGGSQYGIAPRLASIRTTAANPSLWILILLFSLAIGANIGVYMMLPLYLVTDMGFDRNWANTVVGLSRWAGMFVVIGAGFLADRMSPQRAMAIVLALGGISTALLGAVHGPLLLAAVFLQPMSAACFFPAGFIALTRISPLTISLCMPLAFLLGAGAIPAVIGAMAKADHFAMAMVLTGLLIAGGAMLTPLVIITETKKAYEEKTGHEKTVGRQPLDNSGNTLNEGPKL